MYAIFFILLTLTGVPICFVLAISGLIYIAMIGEPYGTILIQRMTGDIDSFVFLCVPFFLLAGEIMNTGGITRHLLSLSRILVGGIRGGLAHVNIVVSMFFAGVTGAATADTSAIGSTLIPAMVREGYDPDFSTAVTATSSTIGPIIPPSIPMVILGLVASMSIGRLFLAGIIPGIMLGFFQMGVVVYYAKKRKYPKGEGRPSIGKMVKVTLNALPALGLPVIILGGLTTGVFTPTEASSVAVVYAIFCGIFVYRSLKWSQLPRLFLNAGIMTGTIMIIIAGAGVLGWVLTAEMIPQKIGAFLTSITSNKYLLLILINLLLLFIGTFMEAIVAIIIMTPILLPAVVSVGVDPLHFGMIMVLNLMIGLTTPPLGICLFVASVIAKISVERIVKAIWPFILASIVVLVLVTFFPFLSLWIPNLIIR